MDQTIHNLFFRQNPDLQGKPQFQNQCKNGNYWMQFLVQAVQTPCVCTLCFLGTESGFYLLKNNLTQQKKIMLSRIRVPVKISCHIFDCCPTYCCLAVNYKATFTILKQLSENGALVKTQDPLKKLFKIMLLLTSFPDIHSGKPGS